MHLLIDALSVNNLSGRHVLLGHIGQIAQAFPANDRITVLVGNSHDDLRASLPASVVAHQVPVGPGWIERALWMTRHAKGMCRQLEVDLVFSPSGMLSPGCDRPQVVLAQNPWPLIPGMAKSIDKVKAALQRRQFSRAQRRARVMVFNSNYMLDLYSNALGPRDGASVVAYQGLDETVYEAGVAVPASARRGAMILSVSVMARHKAVESLVKAFGTLRTRVPDARLVLVGSWPEADYRREVETLVDELALGDGVRIEGHVDQSMLHDLYGSARVFCLLSRCESFGIPALEAQAFGTPAVVAAGTAAPEIVGAGGLTVPQDDAPATAECLRRLLTDDDEWSRLSIAARANANRFHWPSCSAPLVKALEDLRRGID